MPRTARRLYIRLALQDLGRRRTRTLLLALAVALGSGAVFGVLTLLRGIERSMTVGFQRLGADLLVVPDPRATASARSRVRVRRRLRFWSASRT